MYFNGNEIVEVKRFLVDQFIQCSTPEMKLLAAYLGKINPREPTTARVMIPVKEYCAAIGIERPKSNYMRFLKGCVDRLMDIKIVGQDIDSGIIYDSRRLFEHSRVVRVNGEDFIDIIPANDSIPLLFNLKNYIKLNAQNILSLDSSNQMLLCYLMKEKQAQRKMIFEISVEDLRKRIGIEPSEYEKFNNFKSKVLDACQKAFSERTDICFTYERGKTGAHGKWETIIFHIKPNKKIEKQQTAIKALANNVSDKDDKDVYFTKMLESCEKKLLYRLNGIEIEWLKSWIEEYKFSEELINYAFQENAFRRYMSMKNINDTLIKWHENNITTVEAAKEFCENEHKKNIKNAARNKKTNNSVWRTGEEAGIVCKQSELSNSKEDEVENDEDIELLRSIDDTGKKEEKTIPESVLGMFGDSDIDDDPDI